MKWYYIESFDCPDDTWRPIIATAPSPDGQTLGQDGEIVAVFSEPPDAKFLAEVLDTHNELSEDLQPGESMVDALKRLKAERDAARIDAITQNKARAEEMLARETMERNWNWMVQSVKDKHEALLEVERRYYALLAETAIK